MWDARKEGVLRELLKEKFNQHPTLLKELLSTGSDILVECTADTFWGAGCSLDSRQLDNATYHGQNVMGSLLQELRAEYRDSAATNGNSGK